MLKKWGCTYRSVTCGYLKDIKTFLDKNKELLLVVLVVILLFCLLLPKSKNVLPGVPTPILTKDKPKLFYTPTCGFSKKQLKVLDDNNMKDQFEIINCHENKEACKGIRGVPAFDFDGKKVSGLQSAEKLKDYLKN